MPANLVPVRLNAQFPEELFRIWVVIDRAAVGTGKIAVHTAPAQGNVPPLITNAAVSEVDKAADLSILHKHIGKAQVTVAEHRLQRRLMLLQPLQQKL